MRFSISVKRVILGISFFSPWMAWSAGYCPLDSWRNMLPECPRGDNTLLSAHFPSAAYVISDQPQLETGPAREFTSTVALEILKNSGDRIPLILMPVKESTFEKVKFEVTQYLSKHPELSKKREAWLGSLIHAKNRSYTWQQDYFGAFFSPNTGKPVLRGIERYESRSSVKDKIADLIDAGNGKCSDFSALGSLLKSLGDAKNSGAYYGGNIMGLPGGLCLHGDNQPREFAAQYCGSPENEAIISASWLGTGHVDELVGVVKDPGAESPCDFALTFASPRLALEILKKSPDEIFLQPFAMGDQARADLSYRSSYHVGAGNECKMVRQHLKMLGVEKPRSRESEGRGSPWGTPAGRGSSLPSIISKSFADAEDGELDAQFKLPKIDCSKITNGQVAAAFEAIERGRVTQALVQAKMDEAKKIITSKLRERLPQCQVKVLDLPQLFRGGAPVEDFDAESDAPIEKRYRLPDRWLSSVMPMGVNSLNVGRAVLTPHPQNEAFARKIEQTYSSIGLKNVFIDTFDYSHAEGGGDLHCVTHSLPSCRPAKGR